MIFHCPFPVGGTILLSANMARPLRILDGFRAAGYQVIKITGNARQRRMRIARIKRLIRRGQSVEFAYSETSNLPLFFSEPNRIPAYPFLEYRFFRWLRKRGIPIGLYLRDLHWRFPHFRHYSLYKRMAAVPFYWLDWFMYISCCDRLFLPSAGLGEHLPTRPRRAGITMLPPGCENHGQRASSPAAKSGKGLFLFYVGGVTSPLYDLRPIIACAGRRPDEQVTVCCRKEEWRVACSAYAAPLPGNVRIVHAQGPELEPYYREADLFLFALKPYEYLNLAMPYKVFEAISYQLPIVAFSGSEVARWIEAEDAGWIVGNLEELIDLIGRLQRHPNLIAEKRVGLSALAEKHSWTRRAQLVANALGAKMSAK